VHNTAETECHCPNVLSATRYTSADRALYASSSTKAALVHGLKAEQGKDGMKTRLLATAILIAMSLAIPQGTIRAASTPKPANAKRFDALATAALTAMKQRAAELKVTGVAVVAYAPGQTIQSWTSKMAVVGKMKDPPSATEKGNNLLGIAYAKAAEMADTIQDSGKAGRPPMTGEFGWQGGVVAHAKTGFVIVAFSGGKSEDDVQVSRAGLQVLEPAL
jgi:hypothetical protein